MISTIAEFVAHARTLDADGIYDLIEYDIPDALRDEILGLADPESPEPFRSAMGALGIEY